MATAQKTGEQQWDENSPLIHISASHEKRAIILLSQDKVRVDGQMLSLLREHAKDLLAFVWDVKLEEIKEKEICIKRNNGALLLTEATVETFLDELNWSPDIKLETTWNSSLKRRVDGIEKELAIAPDGQSATPKNAVAIIAALSSALSLDPDEKQIITSSGDDHGDKTITSRRAENTPADLEVAHTHQDQPPRAGAVKDHKLFGVGEEREQMRRESLIYQETSKILEKRQWRITEATLKRCSTMFNIPYATLESEKGIIPFSASWGLKLGQGMFSHQWTALSEMVHQSRTLGGGGDGSAAGVGKSYPAFALIIVRYWVAKLQVIIAKYREGDKSEGLGEHHLVDSDAVCPSQAKWPLPCPCSKGSWTNTYKTPSGCSMLIIEPTTGVEWAKTVTNLLYGAPILSCTIFPFRLSIHHQDTAKAAKEKHKGYDGARFLSIGFYGRKCV